MFLQNTCIGFAPMRCLFSAYFVGAALCGRPLFCFAPCRGRCPHRPAAPQGQTCKAACFIVGVCVSAVCAGDGIPCPARKPCKAGRCGHRPLQGRVPRGVGLKKLSERIATTVLRHCFAMTRLFFFVQAPHSSLKKPSRPGNGAGGFLSEVDRRAVVGIGDKIAVIDYLVHFGKLFCRELVCHTRFERAFVLSVEHL